MPYRDRAQRAAWMREYRKRKRVENVSAPALYPSKPAIVRAPESTRVSHKTIDSLGPQPTRANIAITRKRPFSSFKTALELARTFPSGVLASQVCPYCYNTGYSSPGTRCSYCRQKSHL